MSAAPDETAGGTFDVPVPPASQARWLGRSVRQQLGIYTLALIAPILLFTGYLFWQNAATERGRVEGDASDAARSIAAAIDRELIGLFSSIDVLATSGNLGRGDWEAFYRQTKVLEQRQGITTVLADAAGQQLTNSRLPWGAPLPQSKIPLDPALLATGRPFATDLYRGAVTGNPLFAIALGVKPEGQEPLVLFFGLEVNRLRRILSEADIPEGAAVAIVDRRGVIMARNLRHDEFVGQEAARDFLAAATDRQGTWFGRTIDGIQVFGAYARSSLSGYRAGVGVSSADLNAPLWRVLGLLTALGLAIAALSVILGLYFGRRITSPIKALAERADALGRGERVLPLSTGLLEADQVSAALASAATQRMSRETELQDANEEIQRFAYIVSHDLRSPLVNIMGFTTELEALRADVFERLAKLREQTGELADRQGDGQLGEDFDEAIGFIKASISKMDRLINAILRLSREGRREFRPERVDMTALVAGIKASLAHQADEASATIEAGQLPPVDSDRLALEQVFSNLADNAIKYLRRGVPGRVEITGRADRNDVVYEVRDNGRGIDAKDRERVFELFRRSGAQDRPGEGIGLAHVRALVRRLGGKISLISEPGQGSTFTVTLPRRFGAGETRSEAA